MQLSALHVIMVPVMHVAVYKVKLMTVYICLHMRDIHVADVASACDQSIVCGPYQAPLADSENFFFLAGHRCSKF